ncbi:MAG: mercuric transporter MerT family protein [Rhodothermales bacterium]
MSTDHDHKTKWGMAAAVGAAVAASACCTIPLVLVAGGLSGAWIGTFTALEPFRPFFIILALGFLGYAGFREYRSSQRPDCDCEVSMTDRLRRTLLVVGLLATVALIASPWIIRSTSGVDASISPVATAVEQVVLQVDGMTCVSCNVTVRKALTNVEGVQDANVTFEPPQAVVTFDPSRVSIGQLVEATTNVGYPSRLSPAP